MDDVKKMFRVIVNGQSARLVQKNHSREDELILVFILRADSNFILRQNLYELILIGKNLLIKPSNILGIRAQPGQF